MWDRFLFAQEAEGSSVDGYSRLFRRLRRGVRDQKFDFEKIFKNDVLDFTKELVLLLSILWLYKAC